MAAFKQVATVFAFVNDQEKALGFYTQQLGFEKRGDFPYGDGLRWIEVAPPGSQFAIALAPPGEGVPHDRDLTHCALIVDDIEAMHAQLRERGVNVDAQIGKNGTSRAGLASEGVRIPDPVPAQFCFCDPDGNRYLVVQPPAA
jgi:catechol 2,3-dioxygenase-like lactoylglutathione lyase family enzyme